MPFTFSHVAAVLPALRRDATGAVRGRGPLLAGALVTGSLAPDVPFFVDSVVQGTHRFGRTAHRSAAVALLDPLLAAALAAGWTAVRAPVRELLPPRWRGGGAGLPVTADRPSGPAGAARFWLSAACGAATHLAWDAFTHQGRWGVRRYPLLERRLGGAPLYLWVQYASSAVGLLAVGAWTVRTAPPRTQLPPAPPGLPAPVRYAVLTALTTAAATGGAARCRRDRPRDLSSAISSATFGAGAGLALATLAYAAALRACRPRPGACWRGLR